jgi:hypothetical protein
LKIGKEQNQDDKKVAAGNDEYMDRDATKEDKEEGDSTKVVKMVWDEVDPS